MQAPALAVGERVSLLRFAPGNGRLQMDPLAVSGVSHATPLWLMADNGSGLDIDLRCGADTLPFNDVIYLPACMILT